MTTNKYLRKVLLLATFFLFFVSCKKNFLEVDPQGQLTEVQALQDPGAAKGPGFE